MTSLDIDNTIKILLVFLIIVIIIFIIISLFILIAYIINKFLKRKEEKLKNVDKKVEMAKNNKKIPKLWIPTSFSNKNKQIDKNSSKNTDLYNNEPNILTFTDRGKNKDKLVSSNSRVMKENPLELDESQISKNTNNLTQNGINFDIGSFDIQNDSYDLESHNNSQILAPVTNKISIEFTSYGDSGQSTLRGFEHGQTQRSNNVYSKREKFED